MSTLTSPVTSNSHPAARQQGMGAIVHENGVAFRLWAPHAEKVSVAGTFNEWNEESLPLVSENNGYWYVDVPQAKIGDEYRFILTHGTEKLSRIDPYAREVTTSVGNGVIHDSNFDWGDDSFTLPPRNELVIYELHVGSFRRRKEDKPGTFYDAITRLDHLKRIGINAIEIMPTQEFAGDLSWGYNPAHIFAVESAYGGPKAFKEFVKEAHRLGIGIILDVVYNHFGPSDLNLWKFDGWSENDLGGIYFYNDWRSETPWGNTRPDYGRGEVRQFIFDNAMMWFDDYHVDGLRYDATVYIRTVRGPSDPNCDLPEGWSLVQWINAAAKEKKPDALLIAEDLQNNAWLTKDTPSGGAGFDAQWDAAFVHPIRGSVIPIDDASRSMQSVKAALLNQYNADPYDRVIYSESHDEVANGKARIPYEIDPNDAQGLFAQKRSTLAAAMVFTAPGLPMLFQGQEFLEGEWFRDDVPLDWDNKEEYSGIVRLYRDLIHLRLNKKGQSIALTGSPTDVYRVDEEKKVLAIHRWREDPVNHVVIVANFSNNEYADFRVGFPLSGRWRLVVNTDAKIYSPLFLNTPSADIQTEDAPYDGQPCSSPVRVGPYCALIFIHEN